MHRVASNKKKALGVEYSCRNAAIQLLGDSGCWYERYFIRKFQKNFQRSHRCRCLGIGDSMQSTKEIVFFCVLQHHIKMCVLGTWMFSWILLSFRHDLGMGAEGQCNWAICRPCKRDDGCNYRVPGCPQDQNSREFFLYVKKVIFLGETQKTCPGWVNFTFCVAV